MYRLNVYVVLCAVMGCISLLDFVSNHLDKIKCDTFVGGVLYMFYGAAVRIAGHVVLFLIMVVAPAEAVMALLRMLPRY